VKEVLTRGVARRGADDRRVDHEAVTVKPRHRDQFVSQLHYFGYDSQAWLDLVWRACLLDLLGV
jgi:hypothetical protein